MQNATPREIAFISIKLFTCENRLEAPVLQNQLLLCLRNSPVERHHAARDGHVHGHLRRHPPYQNHLFTSVRMKRGVVDVLGSP